MDFKLLDVFRLEAVTPGKGIVKGVMGVFVQGLIFFVLGEAALDAQVCKVMLIAF
ncbi:hypothetical protein [Pseudomonas triticifolii]|uniref:Uncharacterized protein n=1 Tax=Pseudomonas triticifolii TaxID=2762592 RepID=A0ABR7BEV4_9PSED|nr:hypothetical protein [Pseudomonas triticifolii]MBC3955673.1 hypothetical protein [Pseudomonas triticifolii]